jgi:hypothetical protein
MFFRCFAFHNDDEPSLFIIIIIIIIYHHHHLHVLTLKMASNNNNDIEDFNDVEDYSDAVPYSDGNATTDHDQLPSVEEIKSNTNFVAKSSKRRGYVLGLGLLGLMILLIGLIVAAVVDNPEKRANKPVPNVTAALHAIALNGPADFEDESSYQFAAMWNILPDANVHETYSYDRLQQRYAMYCLYHATNPKRTWVENKGWKRMGMDECKWYGVTCEPDENMVTRIELKSNGLGGTIPEEVLLIPKLQVLNVNSNIKMEGDVPSPVCEMQAYRQLDIKVDCSVVGCDCCTNC